MLLRFYVVASHALLLPSLFFTLKRFKKLWLEFIIVLQIFFWSLAYHLCYQYEFCFIERRLHQIYDDFFSLLAIPMAVLYILKIDNIIIKGPFILIAANLNAALISGFDMGMLLLLLYY